MKIDTTLNIKLNILEGIEEAASECGISRSRFISLLIIRFLKGKHVDGNKQSRVKYQNRDKNVKWKRPHVVFDYDLYEKCIDTRKLCKLSVSFIVQIAFNLYFYSVIQELQKGDNSERPLRHYICIGRVVDGVFSYSVFWDFPTEKLLIKYLE